MRKLIALLVLLVHVNTSMFIPVMDEQDVYDTAGNQVGDINSLYQLFAELIFDQDFQMRTDHDDDQAHYFNIAHHVHHYIITRVSVTGKNETPAQLPRNRSAYPLRNDDNPQRGVYEITAPPPEC